MIDMLNKQQTTRCGTTQPRTVIGIATSVPILVLVVLLILTLTLTSCAPRAATGMLGDSVLNISIFRSGGNLSQGEDPEAFATKIPQSDTLQKSLVSYTYGINTHALTHRVKSFATNGRYFVTLFENGDIITNSNSCQNIDVGGNPQSILLSGGVLAVYTSSNRVVDFSIYDCQPLTERTINEGKYTLAGIFSVVITGSEARLYLPGSKQVYATITMPESILAIHPSVDGKNLYVLDERSNIALYNIEKKRVIDGAQIGYILTGATASFSIGKNVNNEPSGTLQLVIPKINQLQYYLVDLELEGVFSPTLRYSGKIDANMCFFSQGEPTLQCDGLVFNNDTWVPVPGIGSNFAYINNYIYYVNGDVLSITDLTYNYRQGINTSWKIPKGCLNAGNLYFKDFDGISKKYNIRSEKLTKGSKPRKCTTVGYNEQTATYNLNNQDIYQFAKDVTPEGGGGGKIFLRKIGKSYHYYFRSSDQ